MAEAAETGPVEREARQLVEAASRWLSAVPDPAASVDERESGEYDDQPADEHAAGDHGAGSGEEHLCRGCPWCRAKAAAGPIGADTLESLAHLLGAAAESLALFAQSRREAGTSYSTQQEAPGSGEAPEQAADSDGSRGPGDRSTRADHKQADHEEDEDMLDALIWTDDEDDEEAAEEPRRSR